MTISAITLGFNIMTAQQSLKAIDVLLVEDSPSDASLTIHSFENSSQPHRIHWVEDGETAMAFIQQQGIYAQSPQPDLILLDLNLPGMHGREVLKAIKASPLYQHIPIIVFTTSENEADIRLAYELDANCYLTKPADLQQFARVIQLVNDFWLTAAKLPSHQ
jgi:two-component system, chemotaxis family, response regulator Rcp1